MCNAITKHLINTGIFSAIIIMLSACSDSKHTEEARQMLDRARSAAEAGQFETAKLTLDSIDIVYPQAVDVRREGLSLMTTVREGLLNTSIARTDSLLAVAQLRGDSLQQYLHKVDNPIESYFVISNLGNVTNGIDPRLMPDGTLYILSRLSTPKIGHTSISVSAGDGTSATTSVVPRDGERNDEVGGVETITFIGTDADTIGSYISNHRDAQLTLRFTGAGNRNTEITLPKQQIDAITAAYGYAANIRERKILNIRRRALEEQLGLSRSQSASLR